jgi:hypothetical protein
MGGCWLLLLLLLAGPGLPRRCWLLERDRVEGLLSASTLGLVRRLGRMIEADLSRFGNGNLSEIEFEFQNEVELSIHIRSPSSDIEYACFEDDQNKIDL